VRESVDETIRQQVRKLFFVVVVVVVVVVGGGGGGAVVVVVVVVVVFVAAAGFGDSFASDYPVLSESDKAYCLTVISGLLRETEAKLAPQQKKSLQAYNAHHARQVTAALLVRYVTCALVSSPLKKYV
jgi:hypothetical protein